MAAFRADRDAVPLGPANDLPGEVLMFQRLSGDAVVQHGATRSGLRYRPVPARTRGHVLLAEAGPFRSADLDRLDQQASGQGRDAGFRA